MATRQAQRRKAKRTTNACVTCRQSKVKCSGLFPCDYCKKRSLECCFADDGRKVTISERYLRHLQKQANETVEVSSVSARQREDRTGLSQSIVARELSQYPQNSANDSDTQIEDVSSAPQATFAGANATPVAEQSWTSPFTLPSMTMRNQQNTPRGWIWLGPSSTASFTARLTLIMNQQLPHSDLHNLPIQLDGDVYDLASGSTKDNIPDLKNLPSLDYSLYVFNAVKFHLGQLFRLFDEDDFASQIHEFYQNATQKVAKSRLWFMKFLLIHAFGKAFLSQRAPGKVPGPPGADFFTRAMDLMPNYTQFWEDPLLAVEVLALVSLYLYSIDRKESAYLYLGHAVRLCLMEGLHTELPGNSIGNRAWKHSYDIWWTIYILDRQLSSILGVPISIHDSDITTPLRDAREVSSDDAILILQVKFSHLLSTIFDALFRFEKGSSHTFLRQTKSTLNSLATLSEELENVIASKFQNSVDSPSKVTLHLTLLYHQCVILVMRPLFLAVLKDRIDRVNQPEKTSRNVSSLMNTLVSVGIESAIKTLQVLAVLLENGLLETFLPFDLEVTMGASILLILAKALFPDLVKSFHYKQLTYSVIDEMIKKGNKVAEARQRELKSLEISCEQMKTQEQALSRCYGQGATDCLGPASSTIPATGETSTAVQTISASMDDLPSDHDSNISDAETQPRPYAEEVTNYDRGFTDFGLYSNDLLTVIDEIGGDDNAVYSSLSDAWIWENFS